MTRRLSSSVVCEVARDAGLKPGWCARVACAAMRESSSSRCACAHVLGIGISQIALFLNSKQYRESSSSRCACGAWVALRHCGQGPEM